MKLTSANRLLKKAETQIEELQKNGQQSAGDQNMIDELQPVDGSETGDETPQDGQSGEEKTMVGWLDLTGHDELSVLPESVFSEYATYYTSAGVNLRSGPGTEYSKIQTVDLGTELQAAAKSGDWTLVSVEGKFGWISSRYLSTQPVEPDRSSTN